MSHYYSEKQESALRLYKIRADLLSNELEIISAAGIFSAKKLDKGTEILIKNCIMRDGWRVLDLGCGCGIIGIAVAKAFPSAEVVMSDINRRAVSIAKKNIKNLKLGNARVLFSDVFEKIKERFDTILLNPPQSAGKQLCFEIIEQAEKHLKKNGLLQLVARHNKGGKTLSEKMMEVFGNVTEAVKKSGYRVYVSRKK